MASDFKTIRFFKLKLGHMKKELIKQKKMVWPQFPIKILRVHFVNFVLDNSNKDKISHSLTKKF